jgi:hypothetical protein
MAFKFLMLLLGIYLAYRFFMRKPAAAVPPPQEPDLFIDHEEVKSSHGKNK